MCEFKVFLDGEQVAEDVVYARIDGDKVTIQDIMGTAKIFESTRLDELNVMTTRLTLSSIKLTW